MDFLSLFRSGNLAGADGPHGFVGDGDAGRVPETLRELGGDGVELFEDDIVGSAGFTVLEGLTTAGDDVHTSGGALLNLGGDDVVGLAEEGAALGVADDDGLDAGVEKHVDGDLTSEGATLDVGVLAGDDELGVAELGLDEADVEEGRGDDTFDIVGDLSHVEDVDEVDNGGSGTIALPVGSDDGAGLGHFLFIKYYIVVLSKDEL